jgi:hypothetical protein
MKQTAVEWFWNKIALKLSVEQINEFLPEFEQAKEMEKEKHEKFNKFLNDEKELGLSDLKTIERIQWYYNTYFNEIFNTNEK